MSKKSDLSVALSEEHPDPQPLRFRDAEDHELEVVTSPLKDDGFESRMCGVNDTGTLVVRLLAQAADVMAPLVGDNRGAAELNDAAALLEGIDPQDAVEGMLAVQMVTAHNAAMQCMRVATVEGQSPQAVEANINRATKLMRTYTAQVEALNRHRSKARQTMIVKHVHVHEGGQAIVGNLSEGQGGGGSR
jgi:hypothetical protein